MECMYPTKEEGSGGVRGGGQKREDFFCLYEGNWLGTKIDCIAVLFVCVGFLFGKLIFLIIPDSVLFFFSSHLHTEITDAMISLFTNNNNISHVTFLPVISSSARQLVSNAVLPPPEILKIAHLKLCAYLDMCAYLDRGLGS